MSIDIEREAFEAWAEENGHYKFLESMFMAWEARASLPVVVPDALRAAVADEREAFCDGHCTWLDHHPMCARAAWQRTQAAGVPDGWKLVPVEPTEEMWGGLARHLMMWLDFGNPTVEALRKHLDMLNIEWPAWMDAESELRGSGVPSKGTRATLIYKAMLADCKGPDHG